MKKIRALYHRAPILLHLLGRHFSLCSMRSVESCLILLVQGNSRARLRWACSSLTTRFPTYLAVNSQKSQTKVVYCPTASTRAACSLSIGVSIQSPTKMMRRNKKMSQSFHLVCSLLQRTSNGRQSSKACCPWHDTMKISRVTSSRCLYSWQEKEPAAN